VGAFGVGAYTMFSICEEPLVVSGKRGEEEAMAFFWKGDGLWTKTGKAPPGIVNISATLSNEKDENNWTSFILPSRDPYPLPDLVEFGQFLTAALTFTQCLANIKVYVNQTLQLDINKTILESHTIATPKASSWWKNDGALISSSTGMFVLGKGSDLTQTSVQMTVSLRKDVSNPDSAMETSTVRARYASAMVKTKIPPDVEKRIIRVTKKNPPKELTVQIFLDAANHDEDDESLTIKRNTKFNLNKLANIGTKQSMASKITDSFSPTPGSGRIFIGFRTSQTTGFGVHLAAPLMPTVEREAIDFVDPALREFNSSLLEVAGILMRLALEHEMNRIGMLWEENAEERKQWEISREEEKRKQKEKDESNTKSGGNAATACSGAKDTDNDNDSIAGSLFGFASYMARGFKSTVVEAIKTVPEILGEDDETTELLNPRDDRPLSMEERDAIVLMKAFCARPSTPDDLVGQYLAKGFSRCLPSQTPPVLTMDGVVRGKDARLCHHGLEAFGVPNVVRRVVHENAKEYHSMVAGCPRLNINDLIMSLREQVLEEAMLIRLLKWWPKFCRIDNGVERFGIRLKEAVRYQTNSENASPKKQTEKEEEPEVVQVNRLESILYYTDRKFPDGLPLPETTFSPSLQKRIGQRTLENNFYRDWWSVLPFEIWTSFIVYHSCMTKGLYPENTIRRMSIVAISKHFDSLERKGRYLELLAPIKDSPFLPCDTDGTDSNTTTALKCPSELYLASSDLSAFEGCGDFHKVAKSLTKEGVSEEFLLAMGVRKTISMDFLFGHLDTLKWNENPKPLINYLLNADLSRQDLLKLRSTCYLPAENDRSSLYAPSDLYLKNDELKIFPFVKFLQWNSSEGMPSAHREFLIKLGLRVDPPLSSIMTFMERESSKTAEARDHETHGAALRYLTSRLGPSGLYESDFKHYRHFKFLPCIRQDLETGEVVNEMQSPSACYYNPSCLVMGFSVLDPTLDQIQIANRTKCEKDPPTQILLKRLMQLVSISQAKIQYLENKAGNISDERKKLNSTILTLFEQAFLYLSTRASDFDTRSVSAMSKIPFIPCKTRGQLVFYLPSQVFFKKSSSTSENGDTSLAESLFQEIEYNAFLSIAGVKLEPSLTELFELMLKKPDEVLDCLGEPKYKQLLRKIAADPPFKHVSKDIRTCPFLLGYLVMDEELESDGKTSATEQKAQFVLARAEDIFIVDNSFLRRQFSMLVSPMEQQLEEFYNLIGSKYVSQVVKKEFQVEGRAQRNTPLSISFAERIEERAPLLLSSSISSRPLISNASKVLNKQYLEIVQVDDIKAKYSFGRNSKLLNVTCCSKKSGQNMVLCITENFDWFDVGTAIGALILERCQLEDAFFLSSLLEASLDTLRSRGFPVDRILRPVAPPPPPPPPPPRPQPPKPQPVEAKPNHSISSNTSSMNGSTEPVKPNSTNQSKQSGQREGDENGGAGFEQILSQMFPHFPPDAIRELLGPNPSKDKAREVANQLASGNFQNETQNNIGIEAAGGDQNGSPKPQKDIESTHNPKKEEMKAPKKKPSSSFMGKMLGSFRHQSHSAKPPSSENTRVIHQHAGHAHNSGPDSNKPSSPANDAAHQKSLESILQQSIESSRSVGGAGVSSPETILKSLPQGMELGSDGCEVIPSQHIHPFVGPYGTRKSRNGIRVFTAAQDTSSLVAPQFLSDNFDAVDQFADILENLCLVYRLNTSTVAVYYDPSGNTIAFNSNKSLYFNLRFFCALHRRNVDSACYSYWFTVMAHELAHNLCTAHNKEHGKYTESFVMLYLPGLAKLLSTKGMQ